MVWALIYALFFHFGPGVLDEEAHEAEMRELHLAGARAAIGSGEVTDEGVLAVSVSREHVEMGAALFAERCVECHGDGAAGRA